MYLTDLFDVEQTDQPKGLWLSDKQVGKVTSLKIFGLIKLTLMFYTFAVINWRLIKQVGEWNKHINLFKQLNSQNGQKRQENK